MKHIGLSITILGMLVPCLAVAQGRTDFSGTWEMDAERSVSAKSGAPIEPVTLVINQTPTTLSVETRQRGDSETIVYNLNGSATEKPAQDNGPFQWRAQWDGAKLVTETHRSVNRATVTVKEVLSLNRKAKELTIDRTLTVQHGYTMRGAKNYSSGQDIFVKTR